MTGRHAWRSFLSSLLAAAVTLAAASAATAAHVAVLDGRVTSDGAGLPGYRVGLFASAGDDFERLGSAVTDGAGGFRIVYRPLDSNEPNEHSNRPPDPVVFVLAEKGPVLLASAVGIGEDVLDSVVVNELTTVAVGNAFAQFVRHRRIQGNGYGMLNAAHMAGNLADPGDGTVGIVLASSPNGTETSTLATFDSLCNVVASCVTDAATCAALFAATTPPGGTPPGDLLQALANLVKNPAFPGYETGAQDPVFLLSTLDPVYQPALAQRPTSWLLFLKITGEFRSEQDSTNLMNGPGNFAIDERGFVWVNDNAVPQPPGTFACAGRRLLEFTPWAERVPGSPYFGGGLSGATRRATRSATRS
jgi:hypothetical protein